MKTVSRALIVLLLTAASASAASVGRVVVLAKAQVTGPVVTLGEVARFENMPAAARESLQNRSLGSAAQPGKSVTLSRAQVKGRLYNAGIDFNRWTFVIPEQVVITTLAEVVTGSRIMQTAKETVESQLASVWVGSPARVEIIGAPADVVLPTGEVALSAVIESRVNRYGAVHVNVEVRQNGRLVRRMDVGSWLRVWVTVMSVSRDLARGAVISADDLQPKEVDIATAHPGVINSADFPIGKRLIQAVQTGTALTESMVEHVPDINPGEIVQLVVNGEGFEITMQVKALEKGSRGDIIRVLNTATRKVLDARVVSPGAVELVTQK